MRKNRASCACRDSSKTPRPTAPRPTTPRPTAVVVVWRRQETRRVRCTARRTQASEPALRKVNLSWYVVFHNVTDCCCCIYEYVSTERRAPSALPLVSRPEPASADDSLATERRAIRELRVERGATSLCSCDAIQLIARSAAAGRCG